MLLRMPDVRGKELGVSITFFDVKTLALGWSLEGTSFLREFFLSVSLGWISEISELVSLIVLVRLLGMLNELRD